MPDMSITGIASGIDWDSMVTKLLDSAKKPALVMLDKRDKLELKKTLWEELRVSMQALQSSLAPLKLASTFKAKQVAIERIDRNTSYKGVLTATVNSDAVIDVHDLDVLKLAQGQVNRSNSFSSATTQFGSILASGSSYFYVNTGGYKARIDVASTDTLNSLAEKINTKLKTQIPPVGVTAAVVDNKLVLKSDNTGLGQTTHTATITRSLNSYDSVLFSSNPSNTDANVEPPTFALHMDLGGVNGGTLTIKGENGKDYKNGVDFDLVNGNRIRWRTHDPLMPPPGAVYQDTYTAYVGDEFAVTATRSSGGNVDTGVLPFKPAASGATITITDGSNNPYVEGTDFQAAVDGSIQWLTANKPADGQDYTVTYTAAGDETVTLEITRSSQDVLALAYADFAGGTTTITQPGSRVWREGIDFEIVQSSNGKAVVQWYSGGAGDAPNPDSTYTVRLQKADGTIYTENVTRSDKDTVSLPNNGKFTTLPAGKHVITYNGVNYPYPPLPLNSPPGTNPWSFVPILDSTGQRLEITWAEQSNPDSPNARVDGNPPVPIYPFYGNAANDTYTVTYSYNSSTFYLSDDGNGALAALGLDKTDEDHYTAAQDAEMILDGEKFTRSSNHIGEAYKNELIKGMTIELKGVGRVSMDVSQDAEKAVTAMQAFLKAYNDILSWINTRMTEKEVDETKKATLDSDDFRMKWGLLRGNSLLRSTKNTMRRVTSQLYSTPVGSRTSRNAIYGAMSHNGIVNAGSFTVTAAGGLIANIPVKPEDTLQDIADRINSPKIDGVDNPFYVPPLTPKLPPTYHVTASVEDDKLVIKGNAQDIVLGGSTHVLSSLGLSYEYSALSQIGLKFASPGEMTAQGQTGELDFDTNAFMKVLENNAEDVSLLVTNFAGTMQTFVDNTIKASTKEVASGVTTAQGSVVREMNAIDEEIKSIDKYLTDFEKRLQTKQESLYKQFSAAEVSLSKMMQQASWLASVTAQLQQQSAGQ